MPHPNFDQPQTTHASSCYSPSEDAQSQDSRIRSSGFPEATAFAAKVVEAAAAAEATKLEAAVAKVAAAAQGRSLRHQTTSDQVVRHEAKTDADVASK